eukprot:252933-Rhodomonas_salina.1
MWWWLAPSLLELLTLFQNWMNLSKTTTTAARTTATSLTLLHSSLRNSPLAAVEPSRDCS